MITEAPIFDQASLTENLSDELTQEHLDKLISMQMVYDIFDGNLPQEKLLYFLQDGTVFKLTGVDIALKKWKELEYVHYLLDPKNQVCIRWKERIKAIFVDQLRGTKMKHTKFVPKYTHMDGHEVEMKKESSFI